MFFYQFLNNMSGNTTDNSNTEVNNTIKSNNSDTEVKSTRLTKKGLFEFLEWAFAQTDDNMCNYSNPKIAAMYLKDTGKYISTSCVRSNRNKWVKVNGQFVKEKFLRDYK